MEGKKKSGRSGFETSRQTSESSESSGLDEGRRSEAREADRESKGSESVPAGSESGGSAPSREGKKYYIDCSEQTEGCSLRLSGSYDEVIDAGVWHAQKTHGMAAEESKLREDLGKIIKEQSDVDFGGFQGRGEDQPGSSSGLRH
jgi:predicted small metal-binding protein